VDSVTVLSACNLVDLGAFALNQGKYNDTTPCNIIAASNNPSGFTVSIHGTNTGLKDPLSSAEWTKMSIYTDTMDTSCTSGCTEAWGYRIKNGTASEYDAVGVDTNNPDSCSSSCRSFDAAGYWHTLNYENIGLPGYTGADVVITNSGPTADDTANFDLELGAVSSGSTAAVDYEDTITITLTPT